MYYEEKVIDGILHHRSSPNTEFREMSKQAMTRRIIELQTNANNTPDLSTVFNTDMEAGEELM